MKATKSTLAILAAALLGAAPQALAQWETVVPGGDTICSDGSPYRFFVHRGDPSRLLIEFEGGGACWNGETCEQDVYNRVVATDPETARQTGQLQGIYDRTNAENPLKDFTHVYIPYCTGDLHWGNAATTYTGFAGNAYVIQHKGAVNATTALNWAGANVPAPAEVVVAGCSAGGYGAALWSAKIARAYPGARMVELADSAAGVVPEGFFATPFASWNVKDAWPDFIPDLALDRVDPASLTLPKLYTSVAGFYPTASLSQFNTRTDSVQIFFYVLSKGSILPGDISDWSAKMVANVDEITAQSPNFRAYLAPGTEHCVINRPSFYTQSVSGKKFSDWVRTLLAGGDPGQVR
ncbi:MAG: esterase [Vicinamibacteria bacterium]|nr:esterase [Vicinamibacteria bacterium]